MTKLLPSLALALIASVGIAAPVMAAPESLTTESSFDSFDAGNVLQRLHDKGVNAVNVAEDFNGRVRATVKLDDGSQVFQYYDEDSLQQIGQNGAATRVLTKLDVKRVAPVVSMDSLTYQGDQTR